jgi:hypothetical protein
VALNDTTKTNIAFKKLIARDHRDSILQWYEETPGGGFNVLASNVWSDELPYPPPAGSTTVVRAYVTGGEGPLRLTEDVAVPGKRGWEAKSGGVRLRGWVPPKYGQSYTVRLYQDDGSGNRGSQIFTTDQMDWFFDCETGYLSIQGSHSYTTPFWVEGYLYIGATGVGGGATSDGKSIVMGVFQGTHGFSVGDVLSKEGSNYVRALASDDNNAEVYGIVSKVVDNNNFVLTLAGLVEGLSGLVDDDVYFLSDSVPGGMSLGPGEINKPVLLSVSATAGIFVNMRGFKFMTGASGYSGYSGWSGYSGYSGQSGEPGGSSGYSGFSGYSGLQGASGYSGYAGTDGLPGASGYSGESGSSGFSGYSGISGFSGAEGASGKEGLSGYSGLSGTSGYSGDSGYSGQPGLSGSSGASGYSGLSGFSGYSGQDGLKRWSRVFLLMGA